MANMDLVTSHRGVAHITTQNVIDLLAGLSGDISGVKIFPNLYNGLAHEITTSTRVQLKPGAGLAGGYFFILNSLYNWDLDPGAVGYSRNDVLFLVIYENFGSLVQSCDLVYAPGPPYPNGSQGGEAEEIGGTNILACFKLLRAVMLKNFENNGGDPMNLNHLASKLHTSTKVLIHADGEDLELTPRLLANKGMCEVLEIGIVGESMVDTGDRGEVNGKNAGEPEMTWLHVTIGDHVGIWTGIASASGCKA